MIHRIEVHYFVEVDDRNFKRAHELAEDKGHGFADAGPIETVRRSLMDEGITGTFPEEVFHLKSCIERVV